MGVTKSQMVHQNIGQGSLYDLSSWKYLIYSTTRFKNNNSLEKRDFSRRNSNRYLALFQVLNWSWAQVSNELLLFWVIKRDELVRIYFRITWYSIRKSTAQARASKTKLPHCSWAVRKALKKLNLKEFEEVQKIFENDTRVTDIRHSFTQRFLRSVNMPFDWLRATQSQIIKLMKSNGLYEQVKQRHLEVISSVAIFGFYGYDPIYSNPFYSTWNSWISENDTKSITW